MKSSAAAPPDRRAPSIIQRPIFHSIPPPTGIIIHPSIHSSPPWRKVNPASNKKRANSPGPVHWPTPSTKGYPGIQSKMQPVQFPRHPSIHPLVHADVYPASNRKVSGSPGIRSLVHATRQGYPGRPIKSVPPDSPGITHPFNGFHAERQELSRRPMKNKSGSISPQHRSIRASRIHIVGPMPASRPRP